MKKFSDDIDYFIRKIFNKGLFREDTKCVEWLGTTSGGYGIVVIDGIDKVVHRVIYECLVGTIPEGLVLDHVVCNNTLCFNVYHLKPVTNRENVLRGIGPTAMNARKTHCIRGHVLSGDNVYVYYIGKEGIKRRCRICANIRQQQYRSIEKLI